MIIGHLPAGYVLSKLLADKLARVGVNPRHVIVAGIIGAIAPDSDMLYFYLVDKPYALFTVPAIYKPWWLNFFLRWSFALELLLVGWAIALWLTKNRVGT